MSRSKPPPNSSADQSRNEYIPAFISKKPFYIDEATTDADYLEHQRLQSANKDTLDKAKWYDRGRKAGPAATKFRKGACENCGAMTHKTKECLSRPRKQGAKWTGRDIQADEVVEDVKLGWDAKRDRWNGYDSREYSTVVRDYEELEDLKRAAAATKSPENANILENGENEDLDTRYAEETDMGRSQPTSTRQLRLREDTAKYLLDLNLDSAKYDPKTRSMDTSTQNLSNLEASTELVDDGFVRPAKTSDDAAEFERAQKYAWELQESKSSNPGTKKLHLQANPTEGEILRRRQTAEQAEKKAQHQKTLLDKYGDQSSHKPSQSQKANQIASSDRYVEYDEAGHIKGNENKQIARSKYAEDKYINNHTTVWGSWWRNFQWGYSCCHSTTKNSYCTGEEGRIAFEASEGLRKGEELPPTHSLIEDDPDSADRLRLEKQGDDVQERKMEVEADTSRSTAKKRTLQEIQTGISEEEMEMYKRNRTAADDPMARMLGRDELVG